MRVIDLQEMLLEMPPDADIVVADSDRPIFGWWIKEPQMWWDYPGCGSERLHYNITPDKREHALREVCVIVTQRAQESLDQRAGSFLSQWVYIGAQPKPKYSGEFLIRKFTDGKASHEVVFFNADRDAWLCFDQDQITHWQPCPRDPFVDESKLTPAPCSQ